MEKGARAAVVLGGCTDDGVWKEVTYAYGRDISIAFQLIDDIPDFSSSTALGKPGSGTDFRLGFATGPVLYAVEEYPELDPLVTREFKNDGDADQYTRSRTSICTKAKEVLGVLPASEAREALEALADGLVRQ